MALRRAVPHISLYSNFGPGSRTSNTFGSLRSFTQWGDLSPLTHCSHLNKLKQPTKSASPLILITGFRTIGTQSAGNVFTVSSRRGNFFQIINKSACPAPTHTAPEFLRDNHWLYGEWGSKSPLACCQPLESRQCEMPCGNMD